ncbi:MAG: LCP family protein [Pseudanabaenaceae cyanobacterium]
MTPTPIAVKKSWFNPARKLLLSLAIITVIAGSIGGGLVVFLRSRPFQKIQDTEAAAFTKEQEISRLAEGLPTIARPVHILVLGTIVLTADRPSLAQPNDRYFRQIDHDLDGHSDAILLVRLDPEQRKISILSIPRDTLVDIPSVGRGKINTANFMGGVMLSARTVSQLLGGTRIDRYVRLNVRGFSQLIDILGGVEVYVAKDMKYQDDSQRLYINLKAGRQVLNGDQAVQYMRFRQDDLGDIGRVQRQQAFLRALIEQKLNVETVVKLPDILQVLQHNLDTNLSVEEMLAVANFAAQIGKKDTRLYMLPGRFSGNEYYISYWLVDQPALARLINQNFQATMPTPIQAGDPQQARIVIQDSLLPQTERNPRLQRALTQLQQAGYQFTSTLPSPEVPPLERTLIIAQSGDRQLAEAVQQALGRGEIRIEATGVLESEVTVRLGKDWQ